ncbi:MAG: ABC transporter permease [Rikenellaceae bacterium]
MKQFLIFVNKEFLHIFRDPRTILILLIIPAIQIILFGFALTSDIKNIDIAVFDQSHDASSRLIIPKLLNSPYFNVVASVDNMDEADKLLQSGETMAVIIFEKGLESDIMREGAGNVQIITDGSDPNTSNAVSRYLQAIVLTAQKELINIAPLQQMSLTNDRITILPEPNMLYNPLIKSSYSFVPGVMGLILMLICSMMTSISIVREKEEGTMDVLLVSPMKPLNIILAKSVPYLALSLINLATILLLSVFLLGVPITGSLFWLLIISIIFIFVALATGLLVSSLVSTQVAAMLMSGLVFMVPVMWLSGMIFPIDNMPFILRAIAQFIPAKWYIVAVKKLMIQGLPVSYVLTEMLILFAMAISFIFISLKAFKMRVS